MIELLNIKWKNFLSYGNQYTEIDFTKINQVLISGTNGNGKSTIMDALCFGLFGKPHRKVKLSQLVNTVNDKDLVVEIDFKVGNDLYKVIRGIKPGIFKIFENGKELDQSSKSRDFQKYLEESILHTDQRTFTQIAFLGTSDSVPFMKLPAATRRAVIEDVLSIRIFATMYSFLYNRFRTLNNDIDNVKKDIDREKDKLSFILHQATPKQNEELALEKRTQLSVAEDQHDTLKQEYDKKKASIGEVVKVPSLGKIPYFLSRLQSNLQILQNDMSFFKDNHVCPRCHQDITEEHKEQIIAGLQTKMNDTMKGHDELKEKEKDIKEKINEAKEHNESISEQKRELTSMKTKLAGFKSLIDMLREDIKRLEAPIITEDTKSVKEDIERNIERLEKRYQELMESLDIHKKCLSILKDDGARAMVVDYYLPVFNGLIAKYLDMFDFNIQFTVDSEFNESIKSRFRDSFQYENFSDGERSRIDLALMFAFRELAVKRNTLSTNILILDEVDAAMDVDGASALKAILYTKDFTDVKTITISHKEQMASYYGHVLTVKREGNFSHIE